MKQINGMVRIHSGSGLVSADREGKRGQSVEKILGTLAGLKIVYN